MNFVCVDQVRALRKLVGLNRAEFSELTGIPFNRLTNIEKRACRMFAEDIIKIAKQFPPFLPWLVLNQDIDLDVLKTHESPIIKIASAKFELGNYPEIFDGKIKSFSMDQNSLI